MTIDDPTAWSLPARLPERLPAAAAAYAAAGIPVFPCTPGGKRPLTQHGLHDASTDPDQIRSWWGRFPTANIGIPTGGIVDVLDIDVHATGTGFPVLRTLHQAGLITGWGHAVRSPSGGLHLYYPADSARSESSWSRGLAHVDFRGVGGYIIAPPSTVTTTGAERSYDLIAHGRSPRPVDAEAIRNLLTPQPDPTARSAAHAADRRNISVQRIASWVAALPEGNRNAGLFWAACRLAEAGLTEQDTKVVLGPAAQGAGLDAREIVSTIRSANRSTHLAADPSNIVPAVATVKAPIR